MKTTDKKFEQMITNITRKVVDYVMKLNNEQVIIEAICNEPFPEPQIPIEASDNEKYIVMGQDFHDLTTREKLIAIKSAIHTHFRLTEGIVLGYGEIYSYQLQFVKKNKEYKVLFSTDGTLLEENMEQYI